MKAFFLLALTTTTLLFTTPATASADVIFDPTDAQDLAGQLAEATASQNVCYGWNVSVNDPAAGRDTSIGSNFGANKPLRTGDCADFVSFTADITYTDESSESEDSATYNVTSSPGGPTTADLDALDLDMGALTGEDPGAPIGNAVAALPLLAADAGIAPPITASPDQNTAPTGAQLTNDPGSDWWRNNGITLMCGLGIIATAAIFGWWIMATRDRRW